MLAFNRLARRNRLRCSIGLRLLVRVVPALLLLVALFLPHTQQLPANLIVICPLESAFFVICPLESPFFPFLPLPPFPPLFASDPAMIALSRFMYFFVPRISRISTNILLQESRR